MPSALEEAALRFRAQLLRQERQAANTMVHAYGEAWQRVNRRLTDLQSQIDAARLAGEEPGISWLYERERLASLRNQIELELRQFAELADTTATAGQHDAVQAALANSSTLLERAAGAEISAVLDRLPREAVEDLIGFASNGSPLRALFDALGPQVARGVEDALVTAVATGMNPRETARLVRRAFGMGLNRALTIARTEQVRAYREASRRNYEANSDILEGWIWLSAADNRTCVSCWAMHGTKHDVTETLDDHPNGRCTMVPWVKGRPRPNITSGEERFQALPPGDQRRILGPAAHLAYQDGAVKLSDFVGRKDDPQWGTMRYAKSLRQVLGQEKAKRYISKVLSSKTPSKVNTLSQHQLQPTGDKISGKFIKLPKKGAMVEPLHATLDAINSVHGDGPLPDLPIRISAGERTVGGYKYQLLPFKSLEIAVSRKGDHPANTFAHEIGHFIDYEQFRNNPSLTPDAIKAIQNWQKVTAESEAAKRIVDLRDHKVKLVYTWGETYADKKYASYLSQHNELWARSYAQYITVRSKNPVMLSELDEIRTLNHGYYPTQWEDADFEPIADAIDALFVSLGWRQ